MIDALGDMVITIPLIRELKKAYPASYITLVCNDYTCNLVEHLPYVDEVKVCNQVKRGKHNFERCFYQAFRFVNDFFRDRLYELVIVPTRAASVLERLIAVMVKSEQRVICTSGSCDGEIFLEINGNILYKGRCNVLDRNVHIMRLLGHDVSDMSLEMPVAKDDIQYVDKLFSQSNVSDKAVKVVICLSTGAKFRDWPAERYAYVAKWLVKCKNAEIILVGDMKTAGEYGNVFKKIFDSEYVHNFIGVTTMRQLSEVLRRSDFYLGGDTGTMHLAAANKLSGVVITKDWEGADVPNKLYHEKTYLFKFLKPKKSLLGCENGCLETEPHCILQITAEDVIDEIEKMV